MRKKMLLAIYRAHWILALVLMLVMKSVSAATHSVDELRLQMSDSVMQTQLEKKLLPLFKQLGAIAQEIATLNQQGFLSNPSADLLALLHLCEQWQTRLDNGFSCRLGALQRVWQAAVDSRELPDRTLLRQQARQHLQLQWRIDAAGIRFSEAALRAGLQLDLQGLWQGWVLDRIQREINIIISQQKWSLQAIHVAYGNMQLIINGAVKHEVSIGLRDLPSVVVPLGNQTLMVLDRQHHLRSVAHASMSQWLVPKEGWPVEFAPSILVRANTAIEAAIFAQSWLALPVQDALQQANTITGVAALAVTETGMFFASKDWYAMTPAHASSSMHAQTFSLTYEIPALAVAEYRAPYVAIWISDAKGEAIRHLHLAGDHRWLRELHLWWRKFGRKENALVDALAGATQKPGVYQIEWDGRDLYGNYVSHGRYQLHLEVVREHGERELIVLPFTLTGRSVAMSAQGAREIGQVKLASSL